MCRPHCAGEAPQIVHQGASGATRGTGGGIVSCIIKECPHYAYVGSQRGYCIPHYVDLENRNIPPCENCGTTEILVDYDEGTALPACECE